MHDQDTVSKVPGFNQPILDAVVTLKGVCVNNCIEYIRYNAPSSEKPYKTFKHIKDNWTDNQIPETWMSIFRSIFGIQLNQ